jgi:hypothetical protein
MVKLLAVVLAVAGAWLWWYRRRLRGRTHRGWRHAALVVAACAAVLAAGALAGYAWLTAPPRVPRTAAVAPLPQAQAADTSAVAAGGTATTEEAVPVRTSPAAEPTPAKPSDPDAPFRRLVVGTWEDHYQGKRTMTLNADGTGSMVVELAGLTAMLYADRLRFEMVWSLEQGRLKKRTLRGEPADKVELILKLMGDRVDERILELTEERLLLLDQNGQTQYDWKRVRSSDTAANRPP